MRVIAGIFACLVLAAGSVRAQTATSLALTSSCPTSGENLPVTFHASVQVGGVTATAATGTVTFLKGGIAIGTAGLVNGEAYSATLADLPLGATTLTAEYAGDAQYGASAGGPLTQTVVAASGAVFATTNLSLTFNSSAVVTSARCLPASQELNYSSQGFYIYHKLTNTTVPLNHMAQLGNNQVLVWSADGTYYAIFLIVPNGRYFKVELVHLSNNKQTGDIDGSWPGHDAGFALDLATPAGYTMQNLSLDGMVLCPFATRSWYYTGGRIQWHWENVEYSQTTKRVAGTGSRTFPISAPEPMGAITFYLSASAVEHDDILMDMWSAEPAMTRPNRVNHPTWTRADVSAWLDRYERELVSARSLTFEAKTPADFYSVADRMFAAGMDELYLFNGYWGGNQAVDDISSTWFPNGLSDIKALRQYCARRGIRLSLHAMSGFLVLADPNFGPLSPGGLSSEVSRWATGTLLDPVTAGSTGFRVQPDAGCGMIVSPPPWGLYSRLYPPYYCYPQGLVSIGNDIVSASTTSGNPGEWSVANVSRSGLTQYGAKWGTNHPAGSRVDFLLSFNGNAPMVDSRSDLLTNLGTRYASLINTLNLSGQYYDGQECNYDLSFVWGAAKFARRVSEVVDHPTLTECSSGFPSSGHFESLFNRIGNQFASYGDFAAHIRLNDPKMIATSIDEVNFTFGRCAAAGQRYLLNGGQTGLPLNTIDNYGAWNQAAASLELWAALGPYLTTAQKSALASWGSDFYEPTENSSQWSVTPKRAMLRAATDVGWSNMQEWGPISPRQFHKAGEVLGGLTSPYAAQSPQIELYVLPGMSATNAANVSLMPASASDLIQPARVTQPVTFSGGAISLTANRAGLFTPDGSAQAYWYYKVAGAVAKLDMSTCRGIAVTVTGDNSGADLVFRISSDIANASRNRDYVVPLNFSGTRTLEIPNGEVMWNKTEFGFMNDYSTVGMNVDYQSISGFQVFIGKVPAGKTASVQITAIQAMKEDRSTGLVNPGLTLNGNSVTIAGTIAYNNYLVYGGGATAKVYDQNWHYTNDLAATGSALSAVTGANAFSVSATGSPNAWLATRVKVSGTPWVITKPATAHEWRFENNTLDSAGTYHGTAVNGPGYVPGKEGTSALIFNGSNQYVTVPDAAGLRFASAQSFTLTAWVKLNSLPNAWTGIVNKGRANYGIWLTPANQWAFGGATDIVSSVTATTGDWTLLTAVQDGVRGTRKLYVNGTLVVSGWAQSSATTNAFFIGAASDTTPGNFFNGAVDDVRLYNLALGADDIRKQVEGTRQATEIRNRAAAGIGPTTAVLNATLAGAGADYHVHACWGTASGGTTAGQWAHTADLGTFTNAVWTDLISHTPTGLLPDTQYYFTTYATNSAGTTTLWAPQVLGFKTLMQVPVATAQSVTVAEDSALAITLDGTSPGGGALTYALRGYPAHGSLTGVPPALLYTPVANYNGADSVSFVVNDGSQDSEVAIVALTVSPVDDAPVATAQSVFTQINTARTIILSGTDLENDALSSVLVSPPAHGTLTGTAPNLLYTPATDYAGQDNFTFKVNDGLLESAPATIDIAVRATKTVTWSNTATSTSWVLPGNWTGGETPVTGDDVVVCGRNASGAFGPAANGDYGTTTLNSLKLDSGPDGQVAVAFEQALQVDGGGIANLTTAALTIPAVTLTADQTWSATGPITCQGVGGNARLTKIGAATLILSGMNTYTGTTTVSAGTLQVGAAGATGTLGGGAVTNHGILSFNRSGSLTLANPISGSGAVKFAGAGTFTLSGSNTYAGATTFNGSATISVSSCNSVATNATLGTVHSAGSSLGAPATAAIGTIGFGGGNGITSKLIYTGTGETTDRAITISTGGAGSTTTLDQSGTGLLKFIGAITRGGSATNGLILQGSAAGTGEISGVIANSSGSLPVTKQGTGTWTLSGVNTYTNPTTLTDGTLRVATIANGGAACNLGKATNAAGNLVFNGGTLKYTGGSATCDRAFTINAGKTATIDTANNLTLAGATGTATTGALTKLGAGTLALTGANTHTGATIVTVGTLALPSGSMASPITVHSAALIGFTVGSPITSTSSLTLDSGAKIKLGGTPLAPASYTLLTAAGGIAGTPVLDAAITGYTLALESADTVLKLNYAALSYVSWAGAQGIPGEAANGDFDHDGIGNAAENVLGTNPAMPNTALTLVSSAGDTFKFRHSQSNAVAADLTKSYQWSSDLTDWKASGQSNAGGTAVIIAEAILTDNAAPANDLIEVAVTITGGPAARVFVRLVATKDT